jgi:hypothetical protein
MAGNGARHCLAPQRLRAAERFAADGAPVVFPRPARWRCLSGARGGAFLATICHVSGWARDSSVVHDYINAAVEWCPAAELFFGWMRPWPPSAASSQPPPL